jgi:hypothetical protein
MGSDSESSSSREVQLSRVAGGITRPLLGLMPAREFLSNFLPRQSIAPSAFRKGIFDGLVELVDGGRKETDIYEPFVSHQVYYSWASR